MSNITKSSETPATEAQSTALAPYAGPLTKPTPGTPEAARFQVDVMAMMDVLTVNETNPRAIVLWDGIPRIVGDLVRAWRKETYTSEAKRLHKR